MINATIKQLASEVATLMGESLALECSPHESPFPDIEDRVRITAPELLSALIMDSKPEELFDVKRNAGGAAVSAEGVATIVLPEDFLRLVYLKMSDWSRPVTRVVTFDEPEFARQSSPWIGIRGTPERPVATQGVNGKGEPILRLYSSSGEAILENFLYASRPEIDKNDTLLIPEALYGRLIEELKRGMG